MLQDQGEHIERAKAGLVEKGIKAMVYEKGNDKIIRVQNHTTYILTSILPEREHNTSIPSSISGQT